MVDTFFSGTLFMLYLLKLINWEMDQFFELEYLVLKTSILVLDCLTKLKVTDNKYLFWYLPLQEQSEVIYRKMIYFLFYLILTNNN